MTLKEKLKLQYLNKHIKVLLFRWLKSVKQLKKKAKLTNICRMNFKNEVAELKREFLNQQNVTNSAIIQYFLGQKYLKRILFRGIFCQHNFENMSLKLRALTYPSFFPRLRL